VGVRVFAAAFAALVLAAPAQGGIDEGAAYLEARRQPNGGFAEPGRAADPALTAWAVLGLRATGRTPTGAAAYLADKPTPSATDLALRILALDALGRDVDTLIARLAGLRRVSGAIGPTVNSTVWAVLALRADGRPAGRTTVRWLLGRQRPSGGWGWYPGGTADSNDTAAAVQALRAAGVGRNARAIVRGLRYLRRLQNGDGGFELSSGRGSDSQSTAWAVQAFLAAGRRPGSAAFAYLRRMQRANGSFRYSARYAITPTWVTAQVLPALARKPFPLS
jgi:squalene-hopene cyclase-like protein/prenyltransferase/squalene oxidase-like repeat protein